MRRGDFAGRDFSRGILWEVFLCVEVALLEADLPKVGFVGKSDLRESRVCGKVLSCPKRPILSGKTHPIGKGGVVL